jgi:SNF2 family DNA or RNA helicase
MKTITLKNQCLHIAFDYNKAIVDAVKLLPFRTYDADPNNRHWEAPLEPENVQPILDLIKDHGFIIAPDAEKALLNSDDAQNTLLKMSHALSSDFQVDGLARDLYPFQRAGVEYAAMTERCFIADDMGIGKTIQGLAVVQHLNAFPCSITAPASMKHAWANEALKWLPNKRVCVIEKSQIYHAYIINGRMHMMPDNYNLPGSYDIIIFNYDILKPKPTEWEVTYPMNMNGKELAIGDILKEPAKAWKADDKAYVKEHCKKRGLGLSSNGIIEKLLDISPKSMIIDESHKAKTKTSQRTKALLQLSKDIRYRLALTGTPIMNRPSELISQLEILGRLKDFGGWYKFTSEYCDRKKKQIGRTRVVNDVSGASNLVQLHEKLRSTCLIRRTKAEVLPDLPTKTRVDLPLQITNTVEYKKAEADVIAWLRENARLGDDFMETIADMDEASKQNAIKTHRATAAAKAQKAEQLARIEHLKGLSAKGKLEPAIEWIENFLETDEKLIVFANHVEMQEALIKQYPHAARIMGRDDSETRAANVERFQTKDDCSIIVCSLKAGSEGITLTAASNVAFLELGWTPAEHDQAEDRSLRIGQEKAVTAHYLIGEDTIDLDIQEIIEAKRKIVNAATDGVEIEDDVDIMDELISRMTE